MDAKRLIKHAREGVCPQMLNVSNMMDVLYEASKDGRFNDGNGPVTNAITLLSQAHTALFEAGKLLDDVK